MKTATFMAVTIVAFTGCRKACAHWMKEMQPNPFQMRKRDPNSIASGEHLPASRVDFSSRFLIERPKYEGIVQSDGRAALRSNQQSASEGGVCHLSAARRDLRIDAAQRILGPGAETHGSHRHGMPHALADVEIGLLQIVRDLKQVRVEDAALKTHVFNCLNVIYLQQSSDSSKLALFLSPPLVVSWPRRKATTLSAITNMR